MEAIHQQWRDRLMMMISSFSLTLTRDVDRSWQLLARHIAWKRDLGRTFFNLIQIDGALILFYAFFICRKVCHRQLKPISPEMKDTNHNYSVVINVPLYENFNCN